RPAPQPQMQPVAATGPVRSSPLVRRIARENNVNLTSLSGRGTGINGRITKRDILSYIEQGAPAAQAQPAAPAAPAARQTPAPAAPAPAAPAPAPAPAVTFTGDVERVPMTTMRKSIAEHMVMSRRTSAHVTTFFEVDCTNVLKAREKMKADYERSGVKLT